MHVEDHHLLTYKSIIVRLKGSKIVRSKIVPGTSSKRESFIILHKYA